MESDGEVQTNGTRGRFRSRGNPCSPFAALEQGLKRYVDASLAPSPISTYSSGEKQFLKFSEHFQTS